MVRQRYTLWLVIYCATDAYREWGFPCIIDRRFGRCGNCSMNVISDDLLRIASVLGFPSVVNFQERHARVQRTSLLGIPETVVDAVKDRSRVYFVRSGECRMYPVRFQS